MIAIERKLKKGFWSVAIQFHPKVGQILLCDFSSGFKAPEMVKKRPALVIASHRSALVTIAALSTTEPKPPLPCHCKIPKNMMPQLGRFQLKGTWLKGDMIYTVGFHRLNLIRLNKTNGAKKRAYFTKKLTREEMKQIYQCVLHGLNLEQLSKYLN